MLILGRGLNWSLFRSNKSEFKMIWIFLELIRKLSRINKRINNSIFSRKIRFKVTFLFLLHLAKRQTKLTHFKPKFKQINRETILIC